MIRGKIWNRMIKIIEETALHCDTEYMNFIYPTFYNLYLS